MEGYADQNWKELASKNSIAAIYMGKKASRFIQGRLIMHGANPEEPITLIENVTRYNQRIFSTVLSQFPKCISINKIKGPTIMLYGLAPRSASEIAEVIDTPNAMQNGKEFA